MNNTRHTTSSRRNKSTPVTHSTLRAFYLYEDSIGMADSRDPASDLSPPDDDSFGRFKERRDTRVGRTRRPDINKNLRKEGKQTHNRRHSHISANTSAAPKVAREELLKRSVSFADGVSGDAVTSVNHYQMYSDEEKAACFYTDRDFRRFRAEHYLGIKTASPPEGSDEQSSEYEKAANDFLAVMADMWNSFLDLAYSSLHG